MPHKYDHTVLVQTITSLETDQKDDFFGIQRLVLVLGVLQLHLLVFLFRPVILCELLVCVQYLLNLVY